jgi:ferrous iron transport protein B
MIHIWERSYLYLRKAGTIILAASVILWALMTYPKTPDNIENPASAIEHTFAGKFGKLIEPVLEPLGFDWKIGVSLTAGFAAKEIIVSTLGTVYSLSETGSENEGLEMEMSGDPAMNPVKAYGLMLFILIYVPCVAVLGTVRKETGSWKWAGFMAVYTVTLAWIVSFIFIKIFSLLF